LADETVVAHEPLRAELQTWLDRARAAGLADESIEALFMTTFRTGVKETA
jgi:GntR family transcriptional regulator